MLNIRISSHVGYRIAGLPQRQTSAVKKKYRILLSIVLPLCLAIRGTGKILDWEDERIDGQLYQRDADHIIAGTESVAPAKHHNQALVLIHGFGESPKIYQGLIEDQRLQQHADIFAPLLPYHSRRLNDLKKLNNQSVNDYLADYLTAIASHYPNLTVVARSYSGAQVASLMLDNKLPENNHIQWILYSPAIYLRPNQPLQRLKLNAYLLWRDYCNYPLAGCLSPNPKSVDQLAYRTLFDQKQLRFKVAPAVKPILAFDRHLRNTYPTVNQDFQLWIAQDDNLVNAKRQVKACRANPHCHLTLFKGGRHTPHIGEQAKTFKDHLVKVLVKEEEERHPAHRLPADHT